jgi:hypothetical protein
MMILIGLDDTDIKDSRGTGHLARQIAADLETDHAVLGVTRHQLLSDPRVPCTSHNSCAAIALESTNGTSEALASLTDRVRALMLANFEPGSDPGLCIAADVPCPIITFGRKVQHHLVRQSEARSLAAVGLAASGDDGRYIVVGHSRDLVGLVAVPDLLAAGIQCVQTQDGRPVADGLVFADKLRPARRGGRPVAVVEWDRDFWRPLKLD